MLILVFFCKQKTAYELRISDWSSDVCSSDLGHFLAVAVLGVIGDRIIMIVIGVVQPAIGQVDVVGRVRQEFQPRIFARQVDEGVGIAARRPDRKSVVWGKSVSVCVDLGGRRLIKKKTDTKMINHYD